MNPRYVAMCGLFILLTAGCAGHNNYGKNSSRDCWDTRSDDYTIAYDEPGIPAKTLNRLAETIDQAISQVEDPQRIILTPVVNGELYRTHIVILDRDNYTFYKIAVYDQKRKKDYAFPEKNTENIKQSIRFI